MYVIMLIACSLVVGFSLTMFRFGEPNGVSGVVTMTLIAAAGVLASAFIAQIVGEQIISQVPHSQS